MPDETKQGHTASFLPLAGIRILVVDDEEDMRTYLLALFADAGAEVSEAGDGAEAIGAARRFKPDLITLDLSMPDTDGIEGFRLLRDDPQLAGIPVCIVTGHPEFREVIYDRASPPPEGYIDKPPDPAELLATARRIVGLRRKRDRSG